jgi:hypothetical protein
MTVERSTTAESRRAARISGAAFAAGGAVVVIGAAVSILTGRPTAAHDLAPLAGPGDLTGRFGQIAPVVSAALAAIVAVGVTGLLLLRRLQPVAAAVELMVLGLVVDACIGGAATRIGHAADGSVLGASIACMMGGAAVVAGGVIALIGRE